jgi:hypothetical protein
MQVKSIRKPRYVFLLKDRFDVRKKNLYLVLLHFKNSALPEIYLIPATAWRNPNKLFVSRDYKPDQKSDPEWGMNLSSSNMELLEEYRFENRIKELLLMSDSDKNFYSVIKSFKQIGKYNRI